MGLTISKESINKLPVETFPGKIIIVDNIDDALKATNYLCGQKILGFDTETKPSFKRGASRKVALMQLSTSDTCFLFRLNKIGITPALDDIICSEKIIKVGLSVKDDFNAISKRSSRSPQNFIDLQTLADNYNIEDNSLQRIYAILFSKKITKRQRLSNWESSELSTAQQNYAAIDAWACLKIYLHLTQDKL